MGFSHVLEDRDEELLELHAADEKLHPSLVFELSDIASNKVNAVFSVDVPFLKAGTMILPLVVFEANSPDLGNVGLFLDEGIEHVAISCIVACGVLFIFNNIYNYVLSKIQNSVFLIILLTNLFSFLSKSRTHQHRR